MGIAVKSHALPVYKKHRIASLLCIFESTLPPNALRRNCNGKCIELIEGHALEVVVEVYNIAVRLKEVLVW